MAGLFGAPSIPTPQAPPPVPTLRDAAVQETTTDALRKQALAKGRASTLLVDPGTQLSPEASQAKTALGGP